MVKKQHLKTPPKHSNPSDRIALNQSWTFLYLTPFSCFWCFFQKRGVFQPNQSDSSPSATAEKNIDTPKVAFPVCLQIPGGDGGGFHVAKGNGAQAGIQRLHDQALVGAERSRVGIRLGLPALSKPDDDTGTLRGEIPRVAILPLKRKRLTICGARCIGVDNE